MIGSILLALVVFVLELCVVTIGTLRIIFVSRGMKHLAPVLAFFEVLLWLFAVAQVVQNLSDPLCFIAFAGGFTAGNYLGMVLNETMVLGKSVVRIITHRDAGPLLRSLVRADFGATCVTGHGANGPVQIILTIVKRREIAAVTALIRLFDPRAFFSIDDVETVNEGVFAEERDPGPALNPLRAMWKRFRAGLAEPELQTPARLPR